MSSIILNITFDCADPRALARFWAQVTGWPLVEEPAPGLAEAAVGTEGEGRPRLYFVQVPEGKWTVSRSPQDTEAGERQLPPGAVKKDTSSGGAMTITPKTLA